MLCYLRQDAFPPLALTLRKTLWTPPFLPGLPHTLRHDRGWSPVYVVPYILSFCHLILNQREGLALLILTI